ncbi:hypothetical protein Bca101_020316 [Brassica carinata]
MRFLIPGKLSTDTVNERIKSELWGLWDSDQCCVRSNQYIVSSIDVSDEPKPCPFVLEGAQSLSSSLRVLCLLKKCVRCCRHAKPVKGKLHMVFSATCYLLPSSFVFNKANLSLSS